jgi:hypothetical protein
MLSIEWLGLASHHLHYIFCYQYMINTNLLCPMHILFDSMDRTLERYERHSYAEQQQMPTDSETQVSRTLLILCFICSPCECLPKYTPILTLLVFLISIPISSILEPKIGLPNFALGLINKDLSPRIIINGHESLWKAFD